MKDAFTSINIDKRYCKCSKATQIATSTLSTTSTPAKGMCCMFMAVKRKLYAWLVFLSALLSSLYIA